MNPETLKQTAEPSTWPPQNTSPPMPDPFQDEANAKEWLCLTLHPITPVEIKRDHMTANSGSVTRCNEAYALGTILGFAFKTLIGMKGCLRWRVAALQPRNAAKSLHSSVTACMTRQTRSP